MTYTKTDIEVYRGKPAVNVKVGGDWRRVKFPITDTEEWFTQEWIDAHTDDGKYLDEWFNVACELGWEEIQELAQETWPEYMSPIAPVNIHHDAHASRLVPTAQRNTLTVYQEGGQGGWAVVHGLPSIEDWDAVMLARWRSFENKLKAGANNVNYVMLNLYYLNEAVDIHKREVA